MKPANNLREIVSGLWFWSAMHEEYKAEFSSAAWKSNDGLILVDPIELDAVGLAKLETVGKPRAILLTNQNHERHAEWFRKEYGIKIYVHRDAVPGIEIIPDEFFCDGASVPGDLRVLHLPGASGSECAFYHEANGGTVLSGDVFVHGTKGLALLPEQYCDDAPQNRQSARKLLGFKFEVLTVAHGSPIPAGARERVAQVLGPG